MANDTFESDINDLIGEDILEISIDDVMAVIGMVEDEGEPSALPASTDVYKAVVLDFINRVSQVTGEDEEDEGDED